MSSIGKLYFCASQASICAVTEKGIWNEMPFNHELDPIDFSMVAITRADGSEVSVADVKVKKYVRLFTDPAPYLISWQGNLATVFIVEVNAKIIDRIDTLKVRRIADSRIEYLKSIMVDPSLILKIAVYSAAIKERLQASMKPTTRVSIATNTDLFPQGRQVDEQFAIEPYQVPPIPEPGTPPLGSNIRILNGDLLKSPMQTLINTVNCVGVMGKGIALAFKNQYPTMFADYQARCKRQEVRLGKPYCYVLPSGRRIINFPTKGHWRENSSLEQVRMGLEYMVAHLQEWGVSSLAIPPLGCGNGNLNWNDVFPLIQRSLSPITIPVEIYAPHNAYSCGGSFQEKESSDRKRLKTDK